MMEGVDYSRTGSDDWIGLATALKGSSKLFVGRYAVNDLAPHGRGISAAEYAVMKAAGIGVFLYWEGQAEWMLGGEAAGIAAAVNAEQNIRNAGIPPTAPVIFAHDIDPEPRHFEAIRFCVEGAASVIGWDRMGVYGGWLLIDHLAPIYDKMKYYCQTLAWEYGRGVHPAACLYQYGFDRWFGGTNCDLVRAYREDFGQVNRIITPEPPPEPPVQPPTPEPFEGFAHGFKTGTDQHVGHTTYHYVDRVMTVRKGRNAPGYTKPGGKKILTRHEGEKFRSTFVADIDGKQYVWDRNGIVYARSPFTPKITLQRLT